jgi:hypothetical protein
MFHELMDKSLTNGPAVKLCPKAISALECVGIISQARAGGKFLKQPGIASPEHNIVSLHRALELLDDLVSEVESGASTQTCDGPNAIALNSIQFNPTLPKPDRRARVQ